MDAIKCNAPVLQNIEIAPGFFDLRIKAEPLVTGAQPGQFVHLRCDGKPLRRPISICGLNREAGILRMVYEVRGEGTAWLGTLKTGDVLDIVAPLGQGYKLKNKRRVAVVGGGLGVPPLLPVAEMVGPDTIALLGFRTAAAAILIDDLQKLCRTVTVSTNDGTMGHQGFVTDDLRPLLAAGELDLVCACGPSPMLKAVTALTAEYGVETQVSLEERMGCGIGACLCCSCKADLGAGETYIQVCRNGPVLNAKEVRWS